jgi:hypothetical protein
MSSRMSSSSGGLFVRPNNASTGFNSRRLYNEGTSFGSDNLTSNYWFAYNNGSWAGSDTFASNEFYISDYTNTAFYKVASSYSVTMNTSSTRYISHTASKLNSTSAITSIVIYPEGGGTFLTNSGFYLYGISKA